VGEWPASHPGRALHPGKGSPVPIGHEAGWASEPVWTQRLEEKFFASAGDRILDRPVVQSVVRHYNGLATPAPSLCVKYYKLKYIYLLLLNKTLNVKCFVTINYAYAYYYGMRLYFP
jgi:hypothetical protein